MTFGRIFPRGGVRAFKKVYVMKIKYSLNFAIFVHPKCTKKIARKFILIKFVNSIIDGSTNKNKTEKGVVWSKISRGVDGLGETLLFTRKN